MAVKRIIPIFTLVIILVFTVMGCGGGGGTETTETTQAGGDQGQPSVPTATTQAEVKIPREFKSSNEMPDFIQKAISEKRPFIVIFYLKDDYTWKEVKPEVDNVKETYSQINFFIIEIDETKKDQKKSTLARTLEINYLPEIFLIDQNSQIVFQYSGYIDRERFKNEIHKNLKKK